MTENQKYGVVTMIVSFLLILLALMISDGWDSKLDYIENLMHLEINFFLVEEPTGYEILSQRLYNRYYLISIPTKYVMLVFMSTAAYGLTTYLGITPAFTPWKPSVK